MNYHVGFSCCIFGESDKNTVFEGICQSKGLPMKTLKSQLEPKEYVDTCIVEQRCQKIRTASKTGRSQPLLSVLEHIVFSIFFKWVLLPV